MAEAQDKTETKKVETLLSPIQELKDFKYSPSTITRQTELIIFTEQIRNKINEIIRSL